MSDDRALRGHLVNVLDMKGAHLEFRQVVAEFPPSLRGRRVEGIPYTAWQLVEHLRLAQWDILDFCRNPDYTEPHFPDGYWPESQAPPDEAAWDTSVESFLRDLEDLKKLVKNEPDLFARIPWGTGQTLLREFLLVADHNAYHLGQLVLLRRLLGAWKEGSFKL